MRVLVVDDEEDLARVVARGIRHAGMAVDIALTGEDALEKAFINAYDLVVLDRQLPDIHGDEICQTLILSSTPPRILMLTASGTIEARVEGLGVGADDYLVKPFEMAELIARLQALARRPTRVTPPMAVIGDLRIDRSRRGVERGGRSINLTRKEYGVLEMLVDAEGGVVSSEDLLEHVWDEMADPFTNAVRITVMTLRRKLGEPALIETVVGTGYRLAEPT